MCRYGRAARLQGRKSPANTFGFYMMKFRCQSCNKKLGVQDDYIARRVWCPQCHNAVTVPSVTGQMSESSENDNTQYSVFLCRESIRPLKEDELPILPPQALLTAAPKKSLIPEISSHWIVWCCIIAATAFTLLIYLIGK